MGPRPTDTQNVVRRRNPARVSITAAALAACVWLIAAAGRPATAIEPVWYDLPVTDSLPEGIAAGPDGATWVVARWSNQIVRITPDGAVSTFDLDASADPVSIVAGPDEAMWFTEHAGSRIGRLGLDGTLSEFPVVDRAAPTGIAVGPDGALWFTERGVSSIARLTVDGDLTQWSTPTPRAAPLGIALGSDGAMWFTETAVNAIGRIAMDGSITEFPLPAPDRNPQWIAAGPDGALWFAERGVDRIGRITTAGQLTEFPLPTGSAGVDSITAGPDGAMWFTESGSDQVGKIGMHGGVVEVPLAAGTTPTGITTGPDGQLWFSAPGANRVGRLDPAAANDPPPGNDPPPPPADETAPTITIVSPPEGAILLQGEGMLSEYSCSDAGGSGLAACDGPVPSGDEVPNTLGAHSFTVTARDNAENETSLTHGYVVFSDISGPITKQASFSAGRSIPITVGLGGRPQGPVFAAGYPKVRQVDCDTHDPIGADAPADVQAHVLGNGLLLIQWRTDASWSGTCRALVVRLGFSGWSGADADFTLRFD